MSWFLNLFRTPESPRLEIKNISGETILVRPWSSLECRDLSGLTLHNADFRNLRIDQCRCVGTDFTGSKFNNSSLRNCNFENANLSYCDWSGVDARDVRLAGADFYACSFGSFSKKRDRSDLDGAVGVQRAQISPFELTAGARVLKTERHFLETVPIKRKKLTRAEIARLPLMPRSLLVLGSPLGRHVKFEARSEASEACALAD